MEQAEFNHAARRIISKARSESLKLSYEASEFCKEWDEMCTEYEAVLDDLNSELAEIFELTLMND